ncbi:MAG: hypothetical protein ACOVQB_08825 [Polynucleobacter sp.]
MSIHSERLLRTMEQLVGMYGSQQRMGYYPELTAKGFVESAESKGIALLYIQPGKHNQISFVERFNRSIRYEVFGANLFNTI